MKSESKQMKVLIPKAAFYRPHPVVRNTSCITFLFTLVKILLTLSFFADMVEIDRNALDRGYVATVRYPRRHHLDRCFLREIIGDGARWHYI